MEAWAAGCHSSPSWVTTECPDQKHSCLIVPGEERSDKGTQTRTNVQTSMQIVKENEEISNHVPKKIQSTNRGLRFYYDCNSH